MRVRQCHFVAAVLLHIGIIALVWRGVSAPGAQHQAAPQRQAEAPGEQPLPQPLALLPATASPAGAAEEGDTAAMLAAIDYAGSPPLRPPGIPELPQQAAGGDKPTSPGGETAGLTTPAVSTAYKHYLTEVLAPELGEAALNGVHAPSYTVRALSDGMIRDMLQWGYALFVVKAGENFFLAADQGGVMTFRRVAEIPGYAKRALLVRSPFSHSVVQALCREYGYSARDLTTLLFPSASLDRLILAKQVMAARQLETPLAKVLVTEGRLIQRGRAFTFLVEHVTLQSGRALPFEDGERQFLEMEERR